LKEVFENAVRLVLKDRKKKAGFVAAAAETKKCSIM
jgi:hypothetical protein